ncbi:ABC transporter ATP-binding protein [Leisingera daeponensis]|uniref:ABC transporter ATP-binding protein n=1 Tax=Leisingera daeponensis TaxID=405746 RepID=A0ABS7NBC6_9RHOB|nr:ABC transporter ATP-binding protein [Leisingera daeponensis]MBY6138505.1 ABC transporter ATP-binding protein [Leisingera daeponensis]
MLIEAENICRSYRNGGSRIEAVKDCSFSVREGEFLAITGPSGSGKSTLMSILGLLERQTSGKFRIGGQDTGHMSADIRAGLRNQILGFVFQSYNLLPRLTAQENIELPMTYAGVRAATRRTRAVELLRKVGLEERQAHFPNQLSGGEQQRIAIARALANSPQLILADEPTGALDSEKGAQILDLFQEINKAGRTIVVITHDEDVACRADRILRMKDGCIIEDELVLTPHYQADTAKAASFVRHPELRGTGLQPRRPE